MQMPHPLKLIALFSVATLTECGGTTAPDPADVEIALTTGLRFAPADVTIDPGTTVRWVNAASIPHTVTPNVAGQTGAWSSVNTNQPGTVLTHKFTVSGQTYSYNCQIHVAGGMTGIIRVR